MPRADRRPRVHDQPETVGHRAQHRLAHTPPTPRPRLRETPAPLRSHDPPRDDRPHGPQTHRRSHPELARNLTRDQTRITGPNAQSARSPSPTHDRAVWGDGGCRKYFVEQAATLGIDPRDRPAHSWDRVIHLDPETLDGRAHLPLAHALPPPGTRLRNPCARPEAMICLAITGSPTAERGLRGRSGAPLRGRRLSG